MREFQNFLQNLAEALRSLASVVEGLGETVAQQQAQERQPEAEQKPGTAREAKVKEEAVKSEEAPRAKAPASEPRRRKIIRPGKPATAAETVYQVIKSKKGGIDTADLMDETKFDEKKVRNIIYKLKKQEKIKTAKRGVYVAA